MKLSFLEFIASIVVTVLEPAMLNLIMISALDSLSNQTVHAHASVNIKLRGVTIVQWSCRKSALITKSSPIKIVVDSHYVNIFVSCHNLQLCNHSGIFSDFDPSSLLLLWKILEGMMILASLPLLSQ